MNRLKIIAFTHKSTDISEIGKFHIEDADVKNRLTFLKHELFLNELMFLSTCNRVEFIISAEQKINNSFLQKFFTAFNPNWNQNEISWAISNCTIFENETALKHLFEVASSIDSLVVGEREIITQVRNAYEKCNEFNLTGDLIRLAIKKTIETAKQVYTETEIAKKPVSVVSLAYRKLKSLQAKLDSKILIIGSGVTNTAMSKYLKKHGFTNFVVFNRSISNAQKLAADLNCEAHSLSELANYKSGFDVIVSCTGAAEPVVTKQIYQSLIGNDTSKKIVIDLAVPNDIDEDILKTYSINLIAVNNLQQVAKENLQERENELEKCNRIIQENISEFKSILKERKVELAFKEIPQKVKELKDLALNEVFAKDVERLDNDSKETLEKVISYLEKKYISIPMKIAKEVMLDSTSKN